MKNLITVAEYPPSQIPERYIRIRDLKKACIICQHWTSRRDLRKDKRYIVELRGKNMSINEKLYARMYTKTFLRKVHARYYQLSNEELSKVINDYSQKNNYLLVFNSF